MRKLYFLFLPISISCIATCYIFNMLPETIPVHWNLKGVVDSYKPKSFVFFTALLPAGLVALFSLLPKIDPKTNNFMLHKKAYTITVYLIILFFIVMHWISIGAALEIPIKIDSVVCFFIGIMCLGMGNYLPQIKHNYTFGIRTPWTLENPDVWRKTHRLGGYDFALSGLIILTATLLSSLASEIINSAMLFGIVATVMISTILHISIYSYIIFRKLSKK